MESAKLLESGGLLTAGLVALVVWIPATMVAPRKASSDINRLLESVVVIIASPGIATMAMAILPIHHAAIPLTGKPVFHYTDRSVGMLRTAPTLA